MLGTLKHGNIYSYKARRRRSARRTITTLVIIFALIVIVAGGIYTWYMGQKTVVKHAELPTSKVVKPTAPVLPAKNAKVGISLQTLTSPVRPGANALISIKTLPTAACSVTFTYGKENTRSKDTGLAPKAADEFGVANWTWTVTKDVPVGTWPVEVTCAHNGQSAYSRGDVVVANP